MSEFKLHHLVVQLIDTLGSKQTPEELVEYLQKNMSTEFCQNSQVDINAEVQSLAHSLPSPQAFIGKYEQLKQKNVDALSAYVHLLYETWRNDSVRDCLRRTHKVLHSQTEANTMTRSDLAQVRSNLKKATINRSSLASTVNTALVNGTNTAGARMSATNNVSATESQPVSCPSWVQRYPSMSWDFGSVTLVSTVSMPMVIDIPTSSQEHLLIDDLLNVLMGMSGNYIEALPLKTHYGDREFSIRDSIDSSLKELVKQILPLASYYSGVQRFTEEKTRFEYGQVNNALAECMFEINIEYTLFVTQLESEHRSGELTLHKMWYYIQKNLHAMNILNNIVTTINKSDARGGKVLTLLHENISGYIGDTAAQDLCVHLMERASLPYMRMLGMWIYNGIICDPMYEFLVEDKEVFQMDEMPDDYSADYWDKKYLIRRECIPKFLEPITDIILRAGKYLNVIRQCGKPLSNRIESIRYQKEERIYIEAIEHAYQFASKTLLDLVLTEQDLLGRLRSVKHYFLLDQGDFIVTFLALCEKELNKDVNDVIQGRLDSLLDLALRLSSATNDPYKEDLCTELLPYDLQFQMLKILMIETYEEKKYKVKTNRDNLSAIESFSFNYNVKWPLSLVLNRKTLARYQMVFRHLFYCKYVERALCHVWRANKVAKKFPANVAIQYRSAFALRQRMLHYVQNLEYHMMVEVIEPHWCNLINRMSKVTNVDEVLSCHTDFIDTCLKDCMLTIPSLLSIITNLLHICIKFSKFMQLDNSNLETLPAEQVESFQKSINRFDSEFTIVLLQLLAEIRNQNKDISDHDRLFNLLYRLDFNTFYSGNINKLPVLKKDQV